MAMAHYHLLKSNPFMEYFIIKYKVRLLPSDPLNKFYQIKISYKKIKKEDFFFFLRGNFTS